MPDMLCAENIRRTFLQKNGEMLVALDAVSMSVKTGCVSALLGPDGAGKTTLLRIMAGLLRADTGTLLFQGLPLEADDETLRARIGYMPQRFGLYEDLTVQENLDLYADLRGVGTTGREGRYRELLAMSGMEPFRKRLAGKLSGGMKQKLGLICTLVSPPELLLLDEPTVGVDPLSRRELWEIIERLTGSGMSVIISTSYMDEAARCDEVTLLFEGKTLARGTPESIRMRTNGMAWLARPTTADNPRALQARLLGAPGIIDAVPEGGAVRFVHGALGADDERHLAQLLLGATVSPIASDLEDSFMLLLRAQEGEADEAGALPDTPDAAGPDASRPAAAASNAARTVEPGTTESSRHPSGKKIGKDVARDTGAPTASWFCPQAGVAEAQTAKISAGLSEPADPDGPRARGEPVIRTEHVSRLFGDFIAVNDVSFTVNKGEVFGLLGPNGAGKTTTFRMLCGLLPASKGTLHVAGVDVREAREEARRHIGYVAQKFSLYGPLSVRENLEFFASAYGLRGKAKAARIERMVADFDLRRQLAMPAEHLPGGYRQRLAMAVGLLHQPAILFLDEPTSGADPLARRAFWKRISGLAEEGVTIVVTTHFMEEAEYCDRILIQDNGMMLALGTPAEIRAQASPKPDTPAGQPENGQQAEPSQPIPTSASSPMPLSMPLSIEDAFIAIVTRARAERGEGSP